jgi:hypothetical protein
MTKIAGSGYLVRHGSADPDPHQIVMSWIRNTGFETGKSIARYGSCLPQNHYVRYLPRHINNRYINSYIFEGL